MEIDTEQETPNLFGKSELDVLKDRARKMGVEFSNNIGVETLKQRINDKLSQAENEDTENQENEEPQEINPLSQDGIKDAPAKPVKSKTLRQRIYEENMKLVRCRITNLDPKKKDLPGEIVTVANEFLGTVRVFVPYGEVTDEGWHIPYCIFKMLKRRTFVQIRTIKNKATQTNRVETRDVKEFSIEILPPLSREELNQLATNQAAAGSID
jgi:hypothetical protein